MQPGDATNVARRSGLTRRAFVGGSATMAAGAILVACGGNPDAKATAAPTAAASTGGTAPAAAPATP